MLNSEIVKNHFDYFSFFVYGKLFKTNSFILKRLLDKPPIIEWTVTSTGTKSTRNIKKIYIKIKKKDKNDAKKK